MKHFSIIALLLLSLSVAAAEDGERERTFIRGLELFDKAKTPDEFRSAALVFESLLQDGYRNGAVYYNAGNAYMRAGDYGKAIAAYRKAQPLRPRDPYLQANLAQALSLAPGRLPERAQSWWQNVFFWHAWLSTPEKFWTAFGVLAAAFALAMLALKWQNTGLRRAAAGLLAVALLLSADAWITWSDMNAANRAVVVAEAVARKGNSSEYEPAFDKPLKDGAEFLIIDRRGDWVFGHFEGAGDGWLPRSAIVE
jgi:tetratricopeptide (TPR) repeat protein